MYNADMGLYSLDHRRLINEVNSRLSDRFLSLSLGKSKKRGNIGRGGLKVRFPVLQEDDEAYFGMGRDEKIGRMDLSRTYDEDADGDDHMYERLRLRFKEPVRLEQGTIPDCKIIVTRSLSLHGERSNPHREDWVYDGIWKKKQVDLTSSVPTEWFVRDGWEGEKH